MALGDTIVLDKVTVGWGGTAIESACSQARIHIQHVVVPSKHTFGRAGMRKATSDNYEFMVELDLTTSGFEATELDAVITNVMKPPLGPATGAGEVEIVIKPTNAAVSDSNPSYTGTVLVPEWAPLGDGNVNTIIEQTLTFEGTGELVKGT